MTSSLLDFSAIFRRRFSKGFWGFRRLSGASGGSWRPFGVPGGSQRSLEMFDVSPPGPKPAQNGSPDPSRGPSDAVFHPGFVFEGLGPENGPQRPKTTKNRNRSFFFLPVRPPSARRAPSGRGPAAQAAPPAARRPLPAGATGFGAWRGGLVSSRCAFAAACAGGRREGGAVLAAFGCGLEPAGSLR